MVGPRHRGYSRLVPVFRADSGGFNASGSSAPPVPPGTGIIPVMHRLPTKPPGRTWRGKRRRNSSTDRVIFRTRCPRVESFHRPAVSPVERRRPPSRACGPPGRAQRRKVLSTLRIIMRPGRTPGSSRFIYAVRETPRFEDGVLGIQSTESTTYYSTHTKMCRAGIAAPAGQSRESSAQPGMTLPLIGGVKVKADEGRGAGVGSGAEVNGRNGETGRRGQGKRGTKGKGDRGTRKQGVRVQGSRGEGT
jgi:hypothetical protein